MAKKYSYTGNPELFGKDPKKLLSDGYIHIVDREGWSQWLSPDEYRIVKILNKQHSLN